MIKSFYEEPIFSSDFQRKDLQVIDKSIRLSFSGQSTQREADAFVDALRDLVKKHPKE